MSPLELLTNFAKEIGGLEVTDVVTLIGELPGYWNIDHQFTQFIMTMEESHKKAQRAGLPITNNWLVTFATSPLLLANSFPNNCPEWERKPKAANMWWAWKDTFNSLHKNLKRDTRLGRGEDLF